MMNVLKIILLLPAYAASLALRAITKRPRASVVVIVASALIAGWQLRGCGTPVRVGTFNIRRFGTSVTDTAKVTKLIASLDTDILAVQEIQDEPKLRALASALSTGARSYRAIVSACGGTSAMRVGFLYDERRVTLTSTKEYPELAPGGDGRCAVGERPGLLGVFNDGTRAIHLLTIHFQPGNGRDDYAKRRAQWTRAHMIAARLRADGATAVAIVGDANTTGYLDDAQGEQRFVNASARAAGMDVVTRGLSCSEYWKESAAIYAPSLLDHAVATDGLARSGSARVHGYCAALACAPHRSPTPPDEFTTVSDHCPVTFDLSTR